MPEITLESLAAQIAQQQDIINKQNAIIGKLAGKKTEPAAEAKAPQIPTDPVEVGGKKYKFQVATFRLAGDHTVYTAEEAALDEDLLSQILCIEGQGMLKELL